MKEESQSRSDEPLWERLRFLVKERRHVQLGVVEDDLLAAALGLEYAAHRLASAPRSERGEFVEIGVVVEIQDGNEHQPNTRFCSWNDKRQGLPTGTQIFALLGERSDS